MKIAVVGAGIMGLSVAWAAAKAGHRVSVYEQGPVPNAFGSSVDQHRLIRYPYGDEEGYCRMVGQAYAAWEALWADLGERFYVETGTLALSSSSGDWAERSVQTLERLGIACRRLGRDEAASEYPFLAGDAFVTAYHLGSGGVLLAERIVAALARYLIERGVELCTRTKVDDADPARARLRLAGGGRVDADALVIAAGPWASRLVPGLGGRVTPSRQVLAYATPPADLVAAWQAAPMVLAIGPGVGFYAVPPVAGTDLKFGFHLPTLRGDPDRDREPGEDEARAVFERSRGRLRRFAEYRMSGAKTCFYAITAGERFVVERIERAWVMSGFSGHGFKFGALMGERVAAALQEDAPGEALTRWAAGLAG